MIKTRFDESTYWTTSYGEVKEIVDMESSHILNTIRMFLRRPTMIQSMLLNDVSNRQVWRAGANVLEQSISNITSMTIEECAEWFKGCQLYKSMVVELENRGVNVAQMLENFEKEEQR